MKSPAVLAGLFVFAFAEDYRATCSFDSDVPIALKAAITGLPNKVPEFVSTVRVMLDPRCNRRTTGPRC